MFYYVSHEQDISCPQCGGELSYRDKRYRIYKTYHGEKYQIQIRRFKCVCGKLHNELPDVLVPHKHYGREVIENVLDEVSTLYDESTEDYPCESTMKRWKRWFERNHHQIEGIARSIKYAVRGCQRELFNTSNSWLADLRKNGAEWLGTVIKLIFNTGHRMTG